MVKIVWITPEQRSRDVLPFVHQLRRDGHEADVHFGDVFNDIVSHHAKDHQEDYVIVIQSSEDYSYAKDVWSWEKYGEITTACPTRIAPLLTSRARVILVHPLHESTELHDDIKAMGLAIERSNEDAMRHILEQYPVRETIPKEISVMLPLAKRVVFVRHAQRLDEVNKKWCDLASRPQDSPLTQMGIEQSRHIGEWLSTQKWASDIECVCVSPFIRTVQTAHFATESLPLQGKRICVEYGLAEGAPWMAQNALCQTPWHLNAGDLYCISTRIDLDYTSVKHPQFCKGEAYPGRPIEQEEWYDRSAQTIWRMVRQPQYDGKTIVLVTHAGCINFLAHALSGRILPMVGHTAVTSLVCDQYHGKYDVECFEGTDREIFVAQDHLPEDMRSGLH